MPADRPVRVGTRGSLLARRQTEWVLERLSEHHADPRFETITIRTTGDVQLEGPLPPSLGKGLFTRELENSLLAEDIDLAVHSLKDLPTLLPPGLTLGAVTYREEARDALVGKIPEELPGGAERMTVGTCSLRRAAQLRALYPGCRIEHLRGNLDTRLRKVREGVVDCAIVAAAGLRRLGHEGEIAKLFEVQELLPAAGQGALAVEIREGDRRLAELVCGVHCAQTAACVAAERALLQRLGGGCRVPVGAHAVIEDETLHLRGRVLSLDGTRLMEGTRTGPTEHATGIGEQLADTLLDQGAREILEQLVRE